MTMNVTFEENWRDNDRSIVTASLLSTYNVEYATVNIIEIQFAVIQVMS